MAEQSKLELIAIQQRQILITNNYYNSTDTATGYGVTHTRAKSDTLTPIQGKGTGIYMDTYNGGGSIDINGNANAIGSGRIGNTTFNNYNKDNGYSAPDTSTNIGQIHF